MTLAVILVLEILRVKSYTHVVEIFFLNWTIIGHVVVRN